MSATTNNGRAGRLIGEGAVAGVVGAVVVFAIMVMGHGTDRIWTASKLAAYPFLGDRVMRPEFDAFAVALGVLCHFAVGIVWGVLFALVVDGLSRPATILAGAVWGFVVWLVMFVAVVPLAAPRLAEGGGNFGNLIMHVLFGLALGFAILPFQPHATGVHHWWHSRSDAPEHAV